MRGPVPQEICLSSLTAMLRQNGIIGFFLAGGFFRKLFDHLKQLYKTQNSLRGLLFIDPTKMETHFKNKFVLHAVEGVCC